MYSLLCGLTQVWKCLGAGALLLTLREISGIPQTSKQQPFKEATNFAEFWARLGCLLGRYAGQL